MIARRLESITSLRFVEHRIVYKFLAKQISRIQCIAFNKYKKIASFKGFSFFLEEKKNPDLFFNNTLTCSFTLSLLILLLLSFCKILITHFLISKDAVLLLLFFKLFYAIYTFDREHFSIGLCLRVS